MQKDDEESGTLLEEMPSPRKEDESNKTQKNTRLHLV